MKKTNPIYQVTAGNPKKLKKPVIWKIGCYQYKSVFFYVPGTVCYHDIFLLCRGCRFAGY